MATVRKQLSKATAANAQEIYDLAVAKGLQPSTIAAYGSAPIQRIIKGTAKKAAGVEAIGTRGAAAVAAAFGAPVAAKVTKSVAKPAAAKVAKPKVERAKNPTFAEVLAELGLQATIVRTLVHGDTEPVVVQLELTQPFVSVQKKARVQVRATVTGSTVALFTTISAEQAEKLVAGEESTLYLQDIGFKVEAAK
jgi:hypothetical protein